MLHFWCSTWRESMLQSLCWTGTSFSFKAWLLTYRSCSHGTFLSFGVLFSTFGVPRALLKRKKIHINILKSHLTSKWSGDEFLKRIKHTRMNDRIYPTGQCNDFSIVFDHRQRHHHHLLLLSPFMFALHQYIIHFQPSTWTDNFAIFPPEHIIINIKQSKECPAYTKKNVKEYRRKKKVLRHTKQSSRLTVFVCCTCWRMSKSLFLWSLKNWLQVDFYDRQIIDKMELNVEWKSTHFWGPTNAAILIPPLEDFEMIWAA